MTIPQLFNGTYDAEIGFVRNKYPAAHFIITIDSQDLGFVLKKIKARDSGYYRITKIFLKNFFVARNHLSSLAKFT